MCPRRRPPARVRRPTPLNRRPTRLNRPQHPHTPNGGGRAHASLQLCCYARPQGRLFARTCAAATPPLPPPPLPLAIPCSRYKCRGARAWSGWARRGDRAYGTITDITIPHWNGKSSKGCRRWWGDCRRWWSRRRARARPLSPSGSACRPAYSCPTESTARTHICSLEFLTSKPS